eukprot:451393-Pyramimonas_sp.AAC.1
MDIFRRLEQTEWDTLLFFYGVIMAVGGLGLLGAQALDGREPWWGNPSTSVNANIRGARRASLPVVWT